MASPQEGDHSPPRNTLEHYYPSGGQGRQERREERDPDEERGEGGPSERERTPYRPAVPSPSPSLGAAFHPIAEMGRSSAAGGGGQGASAPSFLEKKATAPPPSPATPPWQSTVTHEIAPGGNVRILFPQPPPALRPFSLSGSSPAASGALGGWRGGGEGLDGHSV
jgi:hypothetical protein